VFLIPYGCHQSRNGREKSVELIATAQVGNYVIVMMDMVPLSWVILGLYPYHSSCDNDKGLQVWH